MNIELKNIFSDLPFNTTDEMFDTILQTKHFKIERIVSRGHATVNGVWYDQDSSEWVMVLKGKACLLFDGENEELTMNPGDYINIPAHQKHRVTCTDPEEDTIWLAIHY